MLFKDSKIEDFVKDLSSSMASPGGGSAAALLSALAGSLNSMVYSLTVDKKAFKVLEEEKQNLINNFHKETMKFIEKSFQLMEDDRKFFNELMDCYKLPKNTEEEKNIRVLEITEKTKKAMEAPYNLTLECYKFYDNIDVAVKYGNKMLLSDAGVAAIFLQAALESAILNVKINLNSLKEVMDTDKKVEELEEILKKGEERKNRITKIVNEEIYKK